MTLGERLIQLRAKAGLSQDTLAEQLGVSRQSVSKWENDASVPDLEKLVKLSGVFGVSLDELVKGEVPDSAAPAVKVGVTAEELRLHRQRLLGLLLLFHFTYQQYLHILLLHFRLLILQFFQTQ